MPPDLIPFTAFGGDWTAYETELHRIFIAEIAHGGLTFRGVRVTCSRVPEAAGRWDSFWHLERFSNRPCTTWGGRGTSARTDAGGLMRAYSMDLRERVLLDSDAGMKAADVAAKYRVSGSWVRLLKQRRRETGEVAPRVQRHGRRCMLEPHLHTLAALIAAQRRRGRPLTPQAIGELVVRMAIENPRWGYTRIRGALANLGHEIGRNTVKRILLSRGMAPAPERGQRTPWKTFLQAHWDGLAATDLFTVEVLTLEGLKRYLVLFVIELRTRYVHVVGIHPQPDGAWMEQMARNLTDPGEGFLRTSRYLLHDRDPLYTDDFEEILRSSGVSPVRLPARSPNLNAYAERFVRSIKEECLSRVVPLGEGHLRQLVHEYVEHYHWERNHQGLQNQLLRRPPPPVRPASRVARRTRLGGLLNFYHREAA